MGNSLSQLHIRKNNLELKIQECNKLLYYETNCPTLEKLPNEEYVDALKTLKNNYIVMLDKINRNLEKYNERLLPKTILPRFNTNTQTETFERNKHSESEIMEVQISI